MEKIIIIIMKYHDLVHFKNEYFHFEEIKGRNQPVNNYYGKINVNNNYYEKFLMYIKHCTCTNLTH